MDWIYFVLIVFSFFIMISLIEVHFLKQDVRELKQKHLQLSLDFIRKGGK